LYSNLLWEKKIGNGEGLEAPFGKYSIGGREEVAKIVTKSSLAVGCSQKSLDVPIKKPRFHECVVFLSHFW